MGKLYCFRNFSGIKKTFENKKKKKHKKPPWVPPARAFLLYFFREKTPGKIVHTHTISTPSPLISSTKTTLHLVPNATQVGKFTGSFQTFSYVTSQGMGFSSPLPPSRDTLASETQNSVGFLPVPAALPSHSSISVLKFL